MTLDPNSPKQQLLHSLRGSSVVLPDMQGLLSDWPRYVNPEIKKLREVVDTHLERYLIFFP